MTEAERLRPCESHTLSPLRSHAVGAMSSKLRQNLIAASVISVLAALSLPTAGASAADPVPFASASGSCNQQSKAWSTGTVSETRDQFLARYTQAAGPTTLWVGDFIDGTNAEVAGPDTVWVAGYDAIGGAPFSGSVSCQSTNAGAFSVQLYDIPDAPTSFSGALTHTTIPENRVAFNAPGDGYYVADVTVTQGALDINDGEQLIASHDQINLGYIQAGLDGFNLNAAPGPQAIWSMTIHALPVVLSGLDWTKPMIEPGQISQLEYDASGETNLTAVIKNGSGQIVKTLAQDLHIQSGKSSLTWDGRSSSGSDLPDGQYTAFLTTEDPSGSTGSKSVPIIVNRAPETTFTRKPGKTVRTKRGRARVRFTATSNDPATFECAAKRNWQPCDAKQTFRLPPGRYRFSTRAVDEFGAVDRSPATWKFRVKRR